MPKVMKTEWNLKLLYKNFNDPQIQKDINQTKKAYVRFANKYKKRADYLTSESKLLSALKDYERLLRIVGPSRALLYYFYTKELDSSNQDAQARLTKLSDELTGYENKVLFFGLKLGTIDISLQEKFLKSKKLSPYKYFLEKIFEASKYDLSEPEEKVLNLKSMPSHGLWVEGVQKMLNKQTVSFKGTVLPIAEAQNKVANLNTKDRRELQDLIMDQLTTLGDFAESEINAVVLNKKINDELGGFKHPYSATILGYENNEKSVLNLVDTVTNAFPVSRRFFKLKARLLKLKTLHYADRAATIGKTKKKISFQEAADMYRTVLKSIDSEYVEVFDRFLTKGHIDVYPRKGKSGRAYCSSNVQTPTLVLLNHTDDFNSFMTLAHEMGHAIHAEMSKRQPILYEGHTTSVAETASTLFEQLAFGLIFETLTPEEKIIALHDKIGDDVSTIFRQIAFFNFELDLHTQVREKGSLAKEEITQLLNKHMQAYLGPIFELKEKDGYFFIQVSHFRRFFYVYSYAYGQLISRVMSEKFLEDQSYGKEIKSFLTAGASKSPEHIFKDVGINTLQSTFFQKGIDGIENDIKQLEQLTA